MQGEGDISFWRSSTLVPSICAFTIEGLSLTDEEEDGDCCVGEDQKGTSTAGKIASVQMEEDVSFDRAANPCFRFANR